jgi:hypothetical protein
MVKNSAEDVAEGIEEEDIPEKKEKDTAIWIEKYRPGTFDDIKGQD